MQPESEPSIIWIWIQVITIVVAMIFSPIIAVLITIFYQNRKDKRMAKMNLFLTLIANRGLSVTDVTQPYVNALNTIDVVFHNSPKVLSAWAKYYELANNQMVNSQLLEHARIDLLTTMAKELGYDSLKQTDIEKYYYPQGLYDRVVSENEFRARIVEYLKTGAEMHRKFLDYEPPTIEDKKT